MRGETVRKTVDAAMSGIALYSDLYGSTSKFQKSFKSILDAVRLQGKALMNRTDDASAHHSGKFLLYFADSLELSNRPGEYQPIPGIKPES